jgi:solute carrier family 25 aspartate/glutamate transporter 12/13
MKVPIRLDGPFTELYFGRDRTRAISYSEFSQFLHDFHEECALEAFRLKDPNRTGYITALDFQDIMLSVKKHLLTSEVKDNLVQVCVETSSDEVVS